MKRRHDLSLKLTAYLVSALFAVLILFPIIYTFGNSLKDENKIYEIPPKIFPSHARSVTVVLDYSDYKNASKAELLDKLMIDSTLAIYTIPYDLNKASIYEVKVVGVKDAKSIFYTRVHRAQMRLELDFGLYNNAMIKKEVLLYQGKYKQSAATFGYEFNEAGIHRSYNRDQIGNNTFNMPIGESLVSKYQINGRFIGTVLENKPLLMFENYKYFFQLPAHMYSDDPVVTTYSYWIFLWNTVIVLSFAIFIQTFLCALTAFPLSRVFNRRISNVLLMFFLGTMMVPFVSIMIPQFLMFKQAGFYDNYLALLIPYLTPAATFVYLYKVFFDKLPGSLFEAAKIDGASTWYCFTRICLPLSKPVLSLVALTTFLDNWNDFFWAYMVSERSQLWTLNVALYHMAQNSFAKQNFIMGLSFAAIIPVLFITVLFSKQVRQTIVFSGIKE
ncbi:carbohydrate ABC transporter permease [Paenibacillus sp. OV219]|uniref:carbohydrate ABC transporter permease n=1 Tax=Paenibacillus sp. OV219 TaxID=1884377 RepID=UPI0008D36025|nr:carbohydrate ABC transporter permease [Paenibacillus sp. OV219]SEO04849.1 ABC-type glycerol-3-phosphate transport system, permease component [Paenibacillus sp. OV219]